MPRRRAVITGLGPITAFGVGIDPLWSAMVEGRTAIRRIERFHQASFPCPFAAELAAEQFDVRQVVPKSYRKATKVMCRDIELAVGAAAAAVSDAGLRTKGTEAEGEPTIPPQRMGCHIGAGLICSDIDELAAALVTSRGPGSDGEGVPDFDIHQWGRAGMNDLTPLWLLKYLPNMLACHVTIIHDCQGPSNTITCAEASSALSLGESMRVIERGAADACLTGGAEYRLNPMSFMRQHFAGRLAEVSGDEDAARIVRPFDPGARGSVIGEGGGILVLEGYDSAQSRGASMYAEVAGFASSQSHCPDTIGLSPDPDDTTLAETMAAALDEAGVDPGGLDAVVPFGSSVRHLDEIEAAAIHRALGARAARVPLITTIPNAGNCCAGHGAIALCVAAQALRAQTLPARLNTRDVQGLDANAAPARAARLNSILVMTPSQGGQNAAVVLKRLDPARGGKA